MPCSTSFVYYRSTIAAILVLAVVACSDNNSPTTPVLSTSYTETKLVADDASLGATTVDPNLVNAWGLAFSSGGTLWVSDNGTSLSTLYNGTGGKISLEVVIPRAGGSPGGKPTGQVFNSTGDFLINGGSKALFIFASEDGTISAWNQAAGPNAQIVADRSSNNAVYKGIAIGLNGGANFLYATNFKGNSIDVFDKNFTYVSSFTDTSIPSGYGPFGIHTINGLLYVTYAKQKAPDNEDDEAGVGNGYVDIFNPDGTLEKRFVSNGRLNSPWAVVAAPSTFGSAGGDILIGNFGDGLIGAYDATTGAFLGYLHDSNKASIVIPGLWDLQFGVGSAPATSLYFSSGPDGEAHGLLGTLTAQ
jgi:uncharacterized protein (TIGR03118 family)